MNYYILKKTPCPSCSPEGPSTYRQFCLRCNGTGSLTEEYPLAAVLHEEVTKVLRLLLDASLEHATSPEEQCCDCTQPVLARHADHTLAMLQSDWDGKYYHICDTCDGLVK